MDQPLKFFSIVCNEDYLFGLDGEGKVWRSRNFDCAKAIEWELVPSPTAAQRQGLKIDRPGPNETVHQ